MKHVTNWLAQTGQIKTNAGVSVDVWTFTHTADNRILSDWATHFRNHYCPDGMIDLLIEGTGLSRKDYLTQIVFPDATAAPGPSIRSGDFAELLVADYLEFVMKLWVPRTKMDSKTVRNESMKGCDVIGIHFANHPNFSPNDLLAIYESKAQLVTAQGNRLQDAVDDSAKDSLRKAESLNAMKRRFIAARDNGNASKIARFQNEVDNPYRQEYGAVAVFSSNLYSQTTIQETVTQNHPKSAHLKLLVIHGNTLMPLVHDLYQRATDEA